MLPITPPITPGYSGQPVLNLQDAILALAEHRIFRTPEAPDRPTTEEFKAWVEGLKKERAQAFFGRATLSIVRCFQVQQGLGDNLDGLVEERTAAKLNELLTSFGLLDTSPAYMIEGHVRYPGSGETQGAPVAGAKVCAFDQDVAKATPLDEAVTDALGYYRIAFTEEKYLEGDVAFEVPTPLSPAFHNVAPPDRSKMIKSGPDLWVGVSDGVGGYSVKSDIVYNAPRQRTIDLVAPPPTLERDSEFEEVVRLVFPRLQGLGVSALTPEQIEFLGHDTELAVEQVRGLVMATRMLEAAKALAARHEDSLGDLEYPLMPCAYAFQRAAPESELSTMLGRGEPWWSATISAALGQTRIPKSLSGCTEGILQLLTRLRAWQALEPAAEAKRATLGDLLKTLPESHRLDAVQKRLVSSVFHAVGGDPGKFKNQLEADGVDATRIHAVMRTIGLGELTVGHAPLVANLQQAEPSEQGAAMLDLAGLDRSAWTKLVKTSGVPAHLELANGADRERMYVDLLLRNVELRMPSSFVAARIKDDRIALEAGAKAPVLTFLEKNPRFRFGDDSFAGLLLRTDGVDLSGLDGSAVARVRDELMRLERVARVAPTLEAAEQLFASGYRSAHQVIQRRRDVFVAEVSAGLSGGEQVAGRAYDTARAIVETVTGLLLTHSKIYNHNPDLPVIPQLLAGPPPGGGGGAIEPPLSATFEALFGSQDYCACAPCTSMYSPSAYLVELLQLLDSGPKKLGKSALDVLLSRDGLLSRRPDLAEIELTCDNANVTLPYVDLVLELLESPLASDAPLNRIARGLRDANGQVEDWGFDSDLDKGILPAQLQSDLLQLGIDLGTTPTVASLPVAPGKRWMLRGNGWGIELNGLTNPQALRITIFPQSAPPPLGDDALPRQYVYWAYAPLQAASFPWSLPFDLARAETTSWLDLLGVRRRDILDAYAGGDRWTRLESACEVLGISASERPLYRTTNANPHADWGFTAKMVGGTEWYQVIRKVSIFRQRAGVSHRELLQYLETRFIQESPGLGGLLGLSGDECKSDGMLLGDAAGLLTPSVLRRFFLLIRLTRNLGWSPLDVDRALRAHGSATEPEMLLVLPVAQSSEECFTESVLVFLANLVRVVEHTHLSVEAVINLYRSELDTQRYRDYSGFQPRVVNSYYEQLFYAPSVTRPRAPGLELNAARDDLQPLEPSGDSPKLRLSDYAAELAAALSSRVGDVMSLLPRGRTSVAPTNVAGAVEGKWVEIEGAQDKQIEWVVGRPTEGSFTITVEVDAGDGVVSASGLPVVVSNGINDWTRVLTPITGSQARLRINVERSTPKGTLWFSARVLTSSGLVEDHLSLANLSLACRHLLLARGLRIPVADYLTLINVSGLAPLESPQDTLGFAEAYRGAKEAGVSLADLELVLRHRFQSGSDADKFQAQVARILTTFRMRLQSEDASLVPAPDQAPELVRRLLAEIGWPDRLVDLLLGPDLLGKLFPAEMRAHLAIIDISLDVPPGLSYDIGAKQLVWRSTPLGAAMGLSKARETIEGTVEYGALDPSDQAILGTAFDALATAATALEQEYELSLDPLVAVAKSLELPIHATAYPASSLPPASSVGVPPDWSGDLWYDPAEGAFKFRGPMTVQWRDTLSNLGHTPVGSSFRQVVSDLYTLAAAPLTPGGATPFVSRETGLLTAEALMGTAPSLQERCLLLLGTLVPAVREQRASAVLAATMASELPLAAGPATALVERFRYQSNLPSLAPLLGLPLIGKDEQRAWLLLPEFARSDSSVSVAPAAFPVQFEAIGRLVKLSLLISRLGLSDEQVPWLLGAWQTSASQTPALSPLDLSLLPNGKVDAASPAWTAWMALASLNSLRNSQGPFKGLDLEAARGILTSADPDAAKISALAELLGVDSIEVRQLLSDLAIFPVHLLLDPPKLTQLIECLELLNRAGTNTSTLTSWSHLAVTADAAVRSRQAARSRIGGARWNTAAKQAMDALRLRRRDALVDYWVQKRGLRDANDLYGQILIDPEMGPCMMTSRIIQAISSVQLFIHRIFMGLEEPYVSPAAIDPTHWEWMKNYRVWEANRKVLLYPENWIDPDLRPDKTSQFAALSSQVSQGDSDGAAESAIGTYLDDMLEVAQVELCGMCHRFADGFLTHTYAFGRSRSEPRIYLYRQFTRSSPKDPRSHEGTWSAWKAIDLDIEGDHLIPFVWRDQLYLFWPIFSEEAQKDLPLDSKADPAAPPKHWTLKFGWSQRSQERWKTRRMSSANALAEVPLNTGGTPREFFFFNVSPQQRGVALNVYVRSLSIRLIGGDFQKYPVATMYFDGDDLRLAAGAVWLESRVDKRPPGRVVDCFDYVSVVPLDTPIAVDTSRPVPRHKGMGIARPKGRLILVDGVAHCDVRVFEAPRAYELLPSPEELDVVFRAPFATSPLAQIAGAGSPSAGTSPLPFFFSDSARRFFVYPTAVFTAEVDVVGGFHAIVGNQALLHITAMDHITAPRLRQTFRRDGIDGLMRIESQTEPNPSAGINGLFSDYAPISASVVTRPRDDVEFDSHEPSAPYNWELFFHAPFTVGCSFSRNQRFESARRWLHYVFNPTTSCPDTGPGRYWNFRPFWEKPETLAISDLVQKLADKSDHSPDKVNFVNTIDQWRDNPFEPHLIARMRPRAYMYAVVMRYLDNLIAWGDQLFRRDTMESITEAAQLYILGAQILGPRPEAIPRRTRPVTKSFSDLRGILAGDEGSLGDPLVAAENLIPPIGGAGTGGTKPLPQSLYFCVPSNPRLLEYYDTVQDRLFKLRHCMNIDGVERTLALLEAPLDPGLLVKARAAGLNLADVLADANAPLPHYRFSVMAQKATELCAEVKTLGAALLSALEKRDGEALARLRSELEINLLGDVRRVKELQIEEAKGSIEALGPSLEAAQGRLAYYVGLVSQLESLSIPTGPAGPTVLALAATAIEMLGSTRSVVDALTSPLDPVSTATSEMLQKALARATQMISEALPEPDGSTAKVPMNPAEKRQLEELAAARDLQTKASDQRLIAQMLARIPDFTLGTSGTGGSPVVTFQMGGTLLSAVANFQASITEAQGAEHSYRANLSSILGSYQRRAAEWVQQATNAAHDVQQITKQIAAAGIRAAVAAQELRNHDRQTENAQAVDEFMRNKYTNQELYSWMSQRTSTVYFRAYQLAYDVAKRAEKAFRHELGVSSSDFIQFGYWDGLKSGLLAGEHLFHDLKRMEVAYLDQNRREYEITKHVSLRQIEPEALLRLRATGRCEFTVSEASFDFDFPGQWFRRIKSVAVSIPCVAGPYAGVTATLTLLSSKIRAHIGVAGRYGDEQDVETSYLPIESIAISSGQSDSGLFELSLRDERFLPFEGAGAIGTWRLEFSGAIPQFDYETVSDVILHMRYTAKSDGVLRLKAIDELKAKVKEGAAVGQTTLLSLRHDFPAEWAQFKYAAPTVPAASVSPADPAAPPKRKERVALSIAPKEEHYPFWSRGVVKSVVRVLIFARSSLELVPDSIDIYYQASDGPAEEKKDTLRKDPTQGDVLWGEVSNIARPTNALDDLSLFFVDSELEDVWVAITWKGDV